MSNRKVIDQSNAWLCKRGDGNPMIKHTRAESADLFLHGYELQRLIISRYDNGDVFVLNTVTNTEIKNHGIGGAV